MRTDRDFDLWNCMRSTEIEVVRARMGPCGLGGHFHDKWSIGLILQGACRFSSGTRQYRVTPRELFIIPPFEVHECAAASDDVAYQVMYVADDVLAAAAPHMRRLIGGSRVRVKTLPAPLIRSLQELTGREEDESRLNRGFRQLDRLFRDAAQSRHAPPQHPLQELLHRDWKQAIDLGAAEATTPYSRWHAVRTFRQQIGLPPRLYLRQLRALKARYLLQQGKPLADIAHALHFADQAHFSRAFKEVFGVSPGKLQRVMRDKAV